MADPGSPQPQQQPKPSWSTGRWILFGVIGIVVLIIIAVAATTAGGDDDEAASTTTETPTQESTTSLAESTTTTAGASTTTTAAGASTTTTTETPDSTTTTMAPITITGTGDDVVTIPSGPALLYMEHKGSSNFAVESYTADGERIDLLVNTIGNYTGIRWYDFEEPQTPQTTQLQITADGSWTVEVRDLWTMRMIDASGYIAETNISGTGDEVFAVTGEPALATLTHSGESNFAIWYYSFGGGKELLVNEIGEYKGRKILPGEGIAELIADGEWTFAAEQ